jgi:FAD-linked sulfhydryl oxidase
MGFSPKLWGNEGWHFIHFVALNYPDKPTEANKKTYLMFLETLQFTLPCEGCQFNWSEKLKKHPPNLESRKDFFEWTVDMHNQINETNGKPKISYDKALKKISKKKEIEIWKDSILVSSAITVFILFFAHRISKL